MPFINQLYPIFYTALDYATGITDVSMMVRRPDGIVEGPFIMIEVTSASMLSGTYIYNYLPLQRGIYLFTIDSTTMSKRAEKSIEITEGIPFSTFR